MAINADETLQPCPFCAGGAEWLTIDEADEPDNAGGAVITCSKCGASSHVEFGRKENLVSRWNSRPEIDRLAARPVADHRSFPDAADGRPLPPMGDDLMIAGLSEDDARFVAQQLAQNGLKLAPVAEAVIEIDRLTAERDEARSQVAMAYEVAAGVVDRRNQEGPYSAVEIRALTPADAQAALDKLLAEARLEGWRAGRDAAARCLEQGADEYSCGCDPFHCRCHLSIEQMRIDAEVIRDLPEPKEASHE